MSRRRITKLKPGLRSCALAALAGVALGLYPGAPVLADDGGSPSHEVSFETGVAYDSNPFLSPTEAYFDQNSLSMVEPVTTTGVYSPVRLDGLLSTRRSYVSYLLEGELYPDSQTRNAETFELRVEPGFRFGFGSGRRHALKFGPFAAQNKKVYFDRDTGLAGESDGVDVSDRYTYRSFGGEVELDLELGRIVELSLQAAAEDRDYENVEGLDSFDHALIEAGALVSIRLARRVSMYVEHERQLRSYDDRNARDLTGESLDTNPLLEYSYDSTGAGFRFRNSGSWRLALGWERTDRTDEFSGYNDYVQDRYKLRTAFGGDRWTMVLYGGFRERDFPRAFIFDSPTSPLDGSANPNKTYNRTDYGAELEIEWGHFRVVLGGERRSQDTADPRFTYERSRTTIGGRWVF